MSTQSSDQTPSFLTIAVLQLNEQRVFIHEVIEVGYDVVVLQNGEDAYFVHDISALLFRERVQVHLLPYHQRVVLGKPGDIYISTAPKQGPKYVSSWPNYVSLLYLATYYINRGRRFSDMLNKQWQLIWAVQRCFSVWKPYTALCADSYIPQRTSKAWESHLSSSPSSISHRGMETEEQWAIELCRHTCRKPTA